MLTVTPVLDGGMGLEPGEFVCARGVLGVMLLWGVTIVFVATPLANPVDGGDDEPSFVDTI